MDDKRLSNLAESFMASTNYDVIKEVIDELPDDSKILKKFMGFCLPHIKRLNLEDQQELKHHYPRIGVEDFETMQFEDWKNIEPIVITKYATTYSTRLFVAKCIVVSYLKTYGWLPLRNRFGSKVAQILKISISTADKYLDTFQHDKDFRLSKDPPYLKQRKEDPDMERYLVSQQGLVISSFSDDDLIKIYGDVTYH